MRFNLILIMVMFHFVNGYGQTNDGNFQAFLNPKGARLKINNVELESSSSQSSSFNKSLTPGKYVVEVWHPYFEMHTDTIDIMPKSTPIYRYSFSSFNSEYQQMQLKVNEANKNSFALILGTGLSNALLIIPILRYDKNLEQQRFLDLDRNRINYSVATDAIAIQSLQDSYDAIKGDVIEMQKTRNLKRGIGIPFLVGVNALTTYIFLKKKKRVKGIKESFQPPAPFTFSMPSEGGNQISLTLKF